MVTFSPSKCLENLRRDVAIHPRFDSRAGQIGHSVANGSPPLRRFFGAVLFRRQAAEMEPLLVPRFSE